MDGEAVKELAIRFRQPVEINGFIAHPNDWHITDPVAAVKAAPAAKALDVASLGAVRDYLTANRDAIALDKTIVHIGGPASVTVSGPLRDRSRDREMFLHAKAVDLTDGFIGKFQSIEDFIIGLQMRFAVTDDRTAVLKLLSNIKHETVKTSEDDGVTQVVAAKIGVVMVASAAVPNPVTLTPFRTFREVTQPSAPFVLRVNANGSGLPSVGLFEADGGAWRLTAVDRVRDWLKEALPADVAIVG